MGTQSCGHLFCATVLLKNLSLGFLSRRRGEVVPIPQGDAATLCCVPFVSAILVIEFVYAIVGIVWLTQYYTSCNDITAKSVTLGMYLARGLCTFLCLHRHPLALES